MALNVIKRVLSVGNGAIRAAGPWTCFCGKVGNVLHSAPILLTKGRDHSVEDKPFLICGELPCLNKMKIILDKRTEETEAMPNIRRVTLSCFQCQKRGTKAEMFICSRCKTVLYCSKACQVRPGIPRFVYIVLYFGLSFVCCFLDEALENWRPQEGVCTDELNPTRSTVVCSLGRKQCLNFCL